MIINPISPSPQPLLGRCSCCLVIPAGILWPEGRKVFILKGFLTLLSTLPTAPGCASISHRHLVQQELHRDLQIVPLESPDDPNYLPPSNVFKSDWDRNNKNQSVIKVCINRKVLSFFSGPCGSKCLIRKLLLFYQKNQSFYHTFLLSENPKKFLQTCSTIETIKDNQLPGVSILKTPVFKTKTKWNMNKSSFQAMDWISWNLCCQTAARQAD